MNCNHSWRGFFCVKPEGHEDNHESGGGTTWPNYDWQAIYGSAIGIAGQAEHVDSDKEREFLAALLEEDQSGL